MTHAVHIIVIRIDCFTLNAERSPVAPNCFTWNAEASVNREKTIMPVVFFLSKVVFFPIFPYSMRSECISDVHGIFTLGCHIEIRVVHDMVEMAHVMVIWSQKAIWNFRQRSNGARTLNIDSRISCNLFNASNYSNHLCSSEHKPYKTAL